MWKATHKTTPRLRKKRFSDEELNMLADTLAAHADEVFANNLKSEVQLRKKEIWEEVARKVSAVGTTPCTVKDCTDAEGESQVPDPRASTSRKRPQGTGHFTAGAAPRPRLLPRAPVQGRQADEEATAADRGANTELATTAEGEADGTQSAATSSVGEAAATAPLSDVDVKVEEYEDIDGTIHMEYPHTPSPQSTPQHTTQGTPYSPMLDSAVQLHSPHLTTTPEASPAMVHPATALSNSIAPNDMEARLSSVEARQDSMIELVRQFVAEGEDTRREIREANAGTIAAINSSAIMIRDSLGAVTQVLTSMLQNMQRQQPAPAVQIPSASTPSSTPTSSVPSSPVRMTRRSAMQTEMLPLDTKKARK
ncbi:myb-related transcription factor, partner of profilin-like [Ambystoma mexicanum]|uniref:myb-related transcription factor, partner of profilin-like n=1 Tax=Ambystoma mexicanum TaxID=8296 RepID=UPI0037E96701